MQHICADRLAPSNRLVGQGSAQRATDCCHLRTADGNKAICHGFMIRLSLRIH